MALQRTEQGGGTDATGDTRFRSPGDMDPQPWERLAVWLRARGMTLDEGAPRQLAGGLANLNYVVGIDGRSVVLRRPPPGVTAQGANDMRREWSVLRGLHAGYPLAPAALALCEDVEVLGAQFQLLEFRDGVAVGAHLPASMAELPEVGDRLTDVLVGAMAQLHAVDPQAVGLADLGRPVGFLARQVEGWARRAAFVYDAELPLAAQTVLSWLRQVRWPQVKPSLLHNDLKFDNLLVDPRTLAPLAVVDWDMATLGDPLFDLAVLLSYWVQADDPAELHALGQVPSLVPGFPVRAEVLARYTAASGHVAVDMLPYLVLARFRLVVAWLQLHRLWQRGSVHRPAYAGFAGLASSMLSWTASTLASHRPGSDVL